jgi:hypothetical protein
VTLAAASVAFEVVVFGIVYFQYGLEEEKARSRYIAGLIPALIRQEEEETI